MELFHTSPNAIESGSINQFGLAGESLCFSADVYTMSAAKVITYKMEIDESEIIEVCTIPYSNDTDKLMGIISEIQELADCDEDQAWDYLSQKDQYSEDWEIDLRLQGYAGDAAKALGYKAAQGEDEQGAVYIVPMMGNESQLTEV